MTTPGARAALTRESPILQLQKDFAPQSRVPFPRVATRAAATTTATAIPGSHPIANTGSTSPGVRRLTAHLPARGDACAVPRDRPRISRRRGPALTPSQLLPSIPVSASAFFFGSGSRDPREYQDLKVVAHCYN